MKKGCVPTGICVQCTMYIVHGYVTSTGMALDFDDITW